MFVIVGHGPSVTRRELGEWIDSQTVVRLKNAPMPSPEHFGTRTDYICSRKDHWVMPRRQDVGYLMFQQGEPKRNVWFANVSHWEPWFAQYTQAKPSHGICAVMCVQERFRPDVVAVIGFDSIFRPEVIKTGKWYDRNPNVWFHDQQAESRAIHDIGPRIINLDDADLGNLPG